MASNLLRTSALRGSAFCRALSAEATAAPLGRQDLPARWAHPIRRLSQSSAPDGPPLKSLDDKARKVDQLQRQVQELTQLVERDIAELVERYRDYERCDHGYLERFLTRCGIEKSKFRDDLIWQPRGLLRNGIECRVHITLATIISTVALVKGSHVAYKFVQV